MYNEVPMVTPTSNCTWIKDHINVATNPVAEYLTSKGLVVDDLDCLNDNRNKASCFTARKPGGGDKEANVSSVMEARLDIFIRAVSYYEDLG